MPPVIVICGPTTSGKTSVSIEVAKAVNGEIISADSRQIYPGLNLTTGKVTPEEMQGIPHYGIDIAPLGTTYSASEFKEYAQKCIADIHAQGKVPIICGGTGMYINAALGHEYPDVPPNETLRTELEKLSTEQLFAKLQEKDPERADDIDPHNRRRLVRALEIVEAIGKVPPLQTTSPYKILWIGLDHVDDVRKDRVRQRLKDRIALGMFDEIKEILKQHPEYATWFEGLGLECRWSARVCMGTATQQEAEEALNLETVQYSKRQRTWFRKQKDITWFVPPNIQEIIAYCNKWLGTVR